MPPVSFKSEVQPKGGVQAKAILQGQNFGFKVKQNKKPSYA